jgi:simple sugar transport system ATP-binding protein
VLTESEADTLLSLMKGLARLGIAILFITHRLHEVMEVADRITVLRDGEVVQTIPREEITIERMAELMVGRRIDAMAATSDSRRLPGGPPALVLSDFHVSMPGEEVRGLDLEVRRGEILGLGGLAGYGKVGVANGIMGLAPARGTVMKDGRKLALNDPDAALQAHMAFVSEDRRGVGIMPEESIALNMGLPSMKAQGRFLHRFVLPALSLLNERELRAHTIRMIERLDIRCRGPLQAVGRLSGGNQQKVCVARAMTLEPDILLVSEPTRGIDIGAKKLVLDLIVELNRDKGMTVIMTSSELGELRSVCDRIAIITRGRLHSILAPDAPDALYGLAMAGEGVTAA